MAYVFISYSHKDSEYAHKLADELQKELIEAWIDDRIDFGSQWPHVIQEQLDNCAAFIVVMTPRAYLSEWVQNELSRAQRKRKPIFPLLLEGEPWLSVEARQFANVSDGQLPPKALYDEIAKHAPRRTAIETLTAYHTKIQLVIDSIDAGWGKVGLATLNEQLHSFKQSRDLATTQSQIDQAYFKLIEQLWYFTDNILNNAIPELRLNWRTLKENAFAFYHVGKTNELVSNNTVIHFRAGMNKMLLKIPEMVRAFSMNFSKLKNLSGDKTGELKHAAEAAESALHKYAEEIKIGAEYLAEIIKLVDERLLSYDTE